jgi:hypothetical protein
MRGSSVRQRAKERLKELSFPALKLSALNVKGKKNYSGKHRFLPQHGYIPRFYTWLYLHLHLFY